MVFFATIACPSGLLQDDAARGERAPRPFDVLADLADERLRPVESLLVAEPLAELDAERGAVEIAIEVQEVRLEGRLPAAERRPAPEVHDRGQRSPPGEDAAGGRVHTGTGQRLVPEGEVRGGDADR